MNSALPEMLHCLRSPENFAGNGTDLSVIERQRVSLKLHQQQQHFDQQPQQNYVVENKPINEFYLTPQFHGLINNNSMLREIIASRAMNIDQCLDNTSPDVGKSPIAGMGFAPPQEMATATSSCSLTAAATTMSGRNSSKKRKAEFVVAEDYTEQRIKENAEDIESEASEKNNLETSDTSKENSKVSAGSQKPDYIHVRARRGQATDNHSLAERARREKISTKMKCLQDLVPGCNKITGKAGMLDEIINYVQSLQRQVEFLSMKLASLNPRLDFNIDDFLAKEFPAYVASFPTAATSSELANLAYLQFNPVQQGDTSCGLDMPINPPQTALRGTTSSSVLMPEMFLDSSCFSQVQPFSTGETDLQSLYNVEFH